MNLATHTETAEHVAVKILSKDPKGEPAEVFALKLFNHPHIVRFIDFVPISRGAGLFMEYACGGDLLDYMVRRRPFEEQEACRLLHQLMAGLEEVHSKYVVHRDLKPENLLLDQHMNVKIADFGCSLRFRPGQIVRSRCGTPAYAAPEVIAGDGYVPPQCDLWSCGVVLFWLVARGELPFKDNWQIFAAEYTPPRRISESVADLISKLLKTDPELRLDIQAVRAHTWYQQIAEASIPDDKPPGNAS